MEEKLSLLTELIKLAKSDHKHRQEEYEFLHTLSQLIEVDRKVFERLFEQYADFKPPRLEFERILQFQRLLLLANVDLEVDSSELTFLKKTGLKLGLNPMAVDNVLTEMTKYETGNIPINKLIEIFQVYHN